MATRGDTPRDAARGDTPEDTPVEVVLWDPALRLFHWLLAFCVTGAWLLGKFGASLGLMKMTVHFWFGYMVIALVAFRLVWGVIGPRPARFTHFVRGPGAMLDYAGGLFRREPSYWFGHNPLGALSVLAMLAALIAQAATGLVADPEDFINTGPLAAQVSTATSRKAAGLHELISSLILLLVVLHVGVILFYRYWKREDLVRPMLHGRKRVRLRDRDRA